MIFEVIKIHYQLWTKCRCYCENETKHKVEVIYFPRTQYCWNGKEKDPNGAILCCYNSAMDQFQHWEEMWNEYYSNKL